MPGPARKPTSLLQNMSRRAEREREGPNLASEAPRPISWLPREAKVEWKRVVNWMVQAGTIQTCNRGVLAAYCVAWNTICESQKALAREGHVVKGRRGPTRNPWTVVQREAMAQLRMYASELGISPASMSKAKPVKKRPGRKLSPILKLGQGVNSGPA